MNPALKHIVRDEELWLLPQKAIYWPRQKILFVADLHIGKTAHFRKNGIGIPSNLDKDLQLLELLIERYRINEVVILGDLFHSEWNEEVENFLSWRKKYETKKVYLIEGNHDKLSLKQLNSDVLEVVQEKKIGPFLCLHKAPDVFNSDLYYLSGHIHPAFELKGRGKQFLRTECFYFGKSGAILPAFGSFKGRSLITPEKQSHLFLIGESEVFEVPFKE